MLGFTFYADFFNLVAEAFKEVIELALIEIPSIWKYLLYLDVVLHQVAQDARKRERLVDVILEILIIYSKLDGPPWVAAPQLGEGEKVL